ncbi:MAG: putative aminohydrolase SsnA [Acidobacteriia bacterium]|nr:putative aminohydrolase SsnA [Terriglobia bacterium]
MNSILLKNATLIELDPVSLEKADLRLSQGKIVARARTLRKKPSETVLDLDGKFVLPGWVCAHTHLYSALSRGMPPPEHPPKNFHEILKKIWWRLDWAHNEESIYYSALVGAIEAARCGTTLLIDHHASPSVIKGSLKIIRRALEKVGLRGVLCYEVTDRGGMAERDHGMEENVDFISAHRTHPHFRGLFGAHASFTLKNDSLRACARLANELHSGLHIHVAEDRFDVQQARAEYSQGVIERIEAFEGLNARTLLAHGTHLTAPEIERINQARAWLVHNPRSNMNNSVGYAKPSRFGERVALGTDGISSDMFDEAKYAFFKWRDSASQGNPPPEAHVEDRSFHKLDVLSLLIGGHRLASEIFEMNFGSLRPGSEADLTILNYPSPTPMTKENLGGHLLFGIEASHVESVIVAGRFVVKNRRFPHLDLPSIYQNSSTLAYRLWDRAF